jgi:HEPN domain-containing protein
MTNPDLTRDYLQRAEKRLKAVALLLHEEAYPDVVRESQEVVELALKAILRRYGLAVPFSHDVSRALSENSARFPEAVRALVPRWCDISKQLRRDRELSFYGSEDVTPSEFYGREDAERAFAMAEEVVRGAVPLATGASG